jgi:MFS family permease
MLGISKKYWLLIAMCLQMVVFNVDLTIVNVALPTLAQSLHLTRVMLQGLIDTYVAFACMFMIIGAKIAEHWGKRTIFLPDAMLYGSTRAL